MARQRWEAGERESEYRHAHEDVLTGTYMRAAGERRSTKARKVAARRELEEDGDVGSRGW